MNKIKMITTML